MPSTDKLEYDAIVIGARAAGAATAMLLARNGLRVIAVDRASYGSDTLSTHALLRGGVRLLDQWGLLDELRAAGTPVVRRTSFHYEDDALVVDIEPRGNVDGFYAPRRTVLDTVLVDAARDAGAEVRHGAYLRELVRDARGRVAGVILEGKDGESTTLRAPLVIGADGVKSTVARLTGAETYRKSRSFASFVYGYFAGVEVDGYHFHYASSTAAGAIPTNDGAACVYVSTDPSRFEQGMRDGVGTFFQSVLRETVPELAVEVARSRRTLAFRSFAGAHGYFRRAWGPGFALVGDAGYFKDPATAHGITDALRDAALLSRAVLAGTDRALADYEAERDAISVRTFEITDRIASFAWTMDELRALHVEFARATKGELATIEELPELASPRTSGHGSISVADQIRSTGMFAVR